MGSNQRSGLPLGVQPAPLMSVLVSLDALFPADHPTLDRDGLVLTGWTPGVLHRWLRSTTGGWIGVVTILIATTSDGTFKANDQLVPAEALRPRDPPAGPDRRR